MPIRLALLMPIAALLCVLALVGVAALLASDGEESTQVLPTPTARPADGEIPQLRPESTVCQSILHRPLPDDPQTFPTIYTQTRDAGGITIVASDEVSDKALDEAEDTLEDVFANNDLIEPLVEQRAYVIVADQSQSVLDLPEFGCLEERLGSDFFTHVCGVADRADYPVATVNELDLLGDRSGPCGGLNILYHELGHLVQGWSLDHADYLEVKYLYQAAIDAGKYQNDYARTNPNEYFAEGTQAYFLTQTRGGDRDREWLEEYDPGLYELLRRLYGD